MLSRIQQRNRAKDFSPPTPRICFVGVIMVAYISKVGALIHALPGRRLTAHDTRGPSR